MKPRELALVICGLLLLAPLSWAGGQGGQFPREPGTAEFPASLVQIGIDVTLNGQIDAEVSARGPLFVSWSAPQKGAQGRDEVHTEMVQLDLRGSSSLGPVSVRLNPARPSVGLVVANSPDQDYPAEAFFDVFVEIEIGDRTVLNDAPIRIVANIAEGEFLQAIYRAERPNIPLFGPTLPRGGPGGTEFTFYGRYFSADTRSTSSDGLQLGLELVSRKIDLVNRDLPSGQRSHLGFPFNVSAPGALETGIAISRLIAPCMDEVCPPDSVLVSSGDSSPGNIVFELYPQSDPSRPIRILSQTLAQRGLGQGLDANGLLPPGGTFTILVRDLLGVANQSGPFLGQIVARCGFPQAQGINFIGDSNFTVQAQGYPAVVLK